MNFLVIFFITTLIWTINAKKCSVRSQKKGKTNGGNFEYIQPKNKQDKFDWQLTKAVLDSQSNNVLISPLFVKLLLTLMAEAAGQTINSKTKRELEQVLPNNKNLYDAKEYFKNVLKLFDTIDDQYRVNYGTRVYVDDFVNINQRFAAIAEYNYNADVLNRDFTEVRKSTQLINDWVQHITNGRIKDLVKEESVSKAIIFLINVLHFEGKFRFPFQNTFNRNFVTATRRKSSKEFIEQTGNFYFFSSRHLNAEILRLPYAGHRFSLFIILPIEINGIDGVVDKLDSNTLNNEVQHMEKTEVHVVIPKFKIDITNNLNEVIKSLGITNIFENTATFPLLAREIESCESDFVTSFEVNNPKDFIADHPFIFYIEDDTTGAKLFAGRVSDPLY